MSTDGETTDPSDGALLEFAFRSKRQQRDMLDADFGGRTLLAIRAAIIRESGLSTRWGEWAARLPQAPADRIEVPPIPERLPAPEREYQAPKFPGPEVPRRFHGVTLDSFRTDFAGSSYTGQLNTARLSVEAWVKLARAGKPACLALVGSQGNGKSTLLWGAVAALTAAKVRCYARSWYRLADELRYGGPSPWLPGVVKEPYELRRALQDAPAIAIDELCATAGTTFDESESGKIVKNAWDNRQALLVTTNIHPLSNLMGDAAADRFEVVQLTAPSGRNRE